MVQSLQQLHAVHRIEEYNKIRIQWMKVTKN